jgi:hypothetical protein
MGYSPTNEVSLQFVFTAHQHLAIQIVRETLEISNLGGTDRQEACLADMVDTAGVQRSGEMAAGREVKIVRPF